MKVKLVRSSSGIFYGYCNSMQEYPRNYKNGKINVRGAKVYDKIIHSCNIYLRVTFYNTDTLYKIILHCSITMKYIL